MSDTGAGDPLHGKTLEAILTELLGKHGWEGLAERIPIKCFSEDPSIKSSLIFLRRTPWARKKVESLYLGRLGKRRGSRAPKPGDRSQDPAARSRPTPVARKEKPGL